MDMRRLARTGRSLALTMLVAALLLSGAAVSGGAPADRFDYLVRADFFAGIAGDHARSTGR